MTNGEKRLIDILRSSDDVEQAVLTAIRIFAAYAEPIPKDRELLSADLQGCA